MHQIPDILVRFHLPECRHSAQPNTILNDPEKLAIGIALYIRRRQIRSPRIHPAAGLRGNMATHSVAHRALGAVSFVALEKAGLRLSGLIGHSMAALSSNQIALGLCRHQSLGAPRLCQCRSAEPAY